MPEDFLPSVKFEFGARSWDPTRKEWMGTVLKASRGPDGVRRLSGVASSTTRDLHGDTMLPSALDDMERSANDNLTIFLNHSYNVPEDVGGSVEKATRKTSGVDQDGNPNVDLHFDIAVNETNPRAIATWEAINAGTKLGLSIGAMIPDGGASRNKNGTYLIEHVQLLETSLVGVPANPRSWVDYAVKALDPDLFAARETARKQALAVPLSSPTLTLDGDTYSITGSLAGLNFSTGTTTTNSTAFQNGWTVLDAPPMDITKACPTCGGSRDNPKGGCTDSYHASANSDNGSSTDMSGKDAVHIHDDVGLDLTEESHPELPDSAFACIDSKGRHYPHHTASGAVDKALLRNALARIADPSNTQCGKAHLEAHAKEEGIGDDNKKDVEPQVADTASPDVTDATVTVIQIDTGDGSSQSTADTPSGEAQESEPADGSGLLDEDADGTDALLGDTVTQGITPAVADSLAEMLRGVTAQLAAAKDAERAEVVKRVEAELARDAAFAERDRVLSGTKELLEKLANTPLVRRTAVVTAQNEFHSRFSSIYDDNFLRYLETPADE